MLKIGDRVKCLQRAIDENIGEGCTGTVQGFAQFSPYHCREIYVRLDNGRSGYFYERQLEES